jgi:hypothetical protein
MFCHNRLFLSALIIFAFIISQSEVKGLVDRDFRSIQSSTKIQKINLKIKCLKNDITFYNRLECFVGVSTLLAFFANLHKWYHNGMFEVCSSLCLRAFQR